jgi:hypothetical protein
MRRNSLNTSSILRPAYDGGLARLRAAVALVLNSGALQASSPVA